MELYYWLFESICGLLTGKNCYAERLFPRVYGKDTVLDLRGNKEVHRPREFTDVKLHPERLEQPLHWGKSRMIFVNSMSDLFHEDVPFEFIHKIFAVMALSEKHTFQILTKRPERMLEYFNQHYTRHYVAAAASEFSGKKDGVLGTCDHDICNAEVPYKNVWLGISCENQATADERIPLLLQVPAAVRFLSCEPLLGLPDIRGFLGGYCSWESSGKGPFIDWVIVGGESGSNARPMLRSWARDIRDQCVSAKVPFFFKQWGEWGNVTHYSIKGTDHPTLPTYLTDSGEVVALRDEEYSFEKLMGKIGKKKAGRLLDGRIWNEYPHVELSGDKKK